MQQHRSSFPVIPNPVGPIQNMACYDTPADKRGRDPDQRKGDVGPTYGTERNPVLREGK